MVVLARRRLFDMKERWEVERFDLLNTPSLEPKFPKSSKSVNSHATINLNLHLGKDWKNLLSGKKMNT